MVRIIATINKNPFNPKTTEDILRAGADCLRFNLAHNPAEFNLELMLHAKQICKKVGHGQIIADIPGSKVRLSPYFKPIPRKDAYINVEKGQKYILVSGQNNNAEKSRIAIAYPRLADILAVGQTAVLGDGESALKIISKKGEDSFVSEALYSARIAYMSAIHTKKTAAINAKLPDNIDEILKSLSVLRPDYLTKSFVSSAGDLVSFKELLKKFDLSDIPVIAKIETSSGVKNIDKILQVADGVMVARGDLALTAEFALLGIYQKQIVKACRKHRKLSIVSTQIMESVLTKYIPQRSELTDLTNAIIDGADAVMLCRETAHTDDPGPNVKLVKKIINKIEKALYETTH
jgi:pyruvate kinase